MAPYSNAPKIRDTWPSSGQAPVLGIIQAAVSTGAAVSVRDALRKASIDYNLTMKFWNGLSFIFFALNPNEWGFVVTLLFKTPYAEEVNKWSLELNDEN